MTRRPCGRASGSWPTRGWTPGTPTVFLSTPATEATGTFSPDGRWIAYSSLDVYVRPFPGPGGPRRISTTGSLYTRWSATAHELLFLNQGTIMAAPYTVVGDSFRADTPQIWSPAGQRVATAAAPEQGSDVQDHVVFVFNFGDYLRTIAPGTK